MRLAYPVKEAFLTLQGEGAYSGARAVFLRFAGCNVWSGHEKDRERDKAKGCCAAWCDTDFVGTDGENGGMLAATDIAALVVKLWDHPTTPTVVITGGEPSLLIDQQLVERLHEVGAEVHVETNGSKPIAADVDWVTLSPKPPMLVVMQAYNEVKCVFPAGFDPSDYTNFAPLRYIQPLDAKDRLVSHRYERACVEFVRAHPGWRLSLQTHKHLGLP